MKKRLGLDLGLGFIDDDEGDHDYCAESTARARECLC